MVAGETGPWASAHDGRQSKRASAVASMRARAAGRRARAACGRASARKGGAGEQTWRSMDERGGRRRE